jgi:hypothetical protein
MEVEISQESIKVTCVITERLSTDEAVIDERSNDQRFP